MKKGNIRIKDIDYPVYSVNTLVIGSGAAGLNAALQLYDSGTTDILIVTEKLGAGTSNNAGSDKQTYYKLSQDSSTSDTAIEMAEDLSKGGCMHGDIALCEAQYSSRAFYNLAGLGVPFPHDKYGSYPGYITDHDIKGRGTTAGPLTSRFMVASLLKALQQRGVEFIDKTQIVSLLVRNDEDEKKIGGAMGIEQENTGDENSGFVFFNATNVILASGGPGDLYKYSVYPESQATSIGMALRTGAVAQNLTESQFGIASIKHRWNLSGSYQQVIPRYVSTDKNGNNQKEFLNEFFPDLSTLCKAIFLKGYQWPFDPRKIKSYGSSLIDLLVYRETVEKGRRVFLDFQNNPSHETGEEFSIKMLPDEAREYLLNSKAVQASPIERLEQLNRPAIDLYLDNGIDFRTEKLEIAVCAQHNNGGLKGDIWWESNIKHLFPIGEINGSHGIYRPGGSALNAGQVGGFRAAMKISRDYDDKPAEEKLFGDNFQEQIIELLALSEEFMLGGNRDLKEIQFEIQALMSDYGAHIRNPLKINEAIMALRELAKLIPVSIEIGKEQVATAFRLYDLALAGVVYLVSIEELMEKGLGSRGSYLVVDESGEDIHEKLTSGWKIKMNENEDRMIQEIFMDKELVCHSKWVEPRPIPTEKHWFETLWKNYRDGKIM